MTYKNYYGHMAAEAYEAPLRRERWAKRVNAALPVFGVCVAALALSVAYWLAWLIDA